MSGSIGVAGNCGKSRSGTPNAADSAALEKADAVAR